MSIDNWVSNENLKEWTKQAKKLSIERKQQEKKLLKEGKKRVLIPHPEIKNCFIEKFV